MQEDIGDDHESNGGEEEGDDETANNKKTHPLMSAFKRGRPVDGALDQCLQFVKEIIQEENCQDIWRKRSTQCKCLHSLREGGANEVRVKFVANFLFAFGQMKAEARMKKVIEWCRYAQDQGKLPFVLPEIRNESSAAVSTKKLRVCAHAIKRLVNFGRYKWQRAKEHALKGIQYIDPKKGNKNAALATEVKEAMRDFFEEMKDMSSPRATRVVREEVGLGLRDDEIDLLELPSSFTKRSLYYKFCHSRGWIIKLENDRGKLKKITLEAAEQKFIPSWFSFLQFWNDKYPKLVVSKAREDVCGECYIYANAFRYRATQAANQEDDTNDSGSDDGANDDGANDDNDCEDIVAKAGKHCKQAKSMRELFNEMKLLAKQADTDSTPHAERLYCLVVDYCMNLALPHFGSEQPGETYYY